jgi:hypothetical protein
MTGSHTLFDSISSDSVVLPWTSDNDSTENRKILREFKLASHFQTILFSISNPSYACHF